MSYGCREPKNTSYTIRNEKIDYTYSKKLKFAKKMEILMDALKSMPMQELTKLDLSNKSINSCDVAALTEVLSSMTGLKTFNLRSNSVGEKTNNLVKVLLGIKTLIHLDLSFNNMGTTAVKEFANNTSELHLKYLNLSFNEIRDEGAIAIAKALPFMPALTCLNLSSNLFGDEGAIALANALPSTKKLTRLFLYNNHIDDAGARAIVEALPPALTKLDLSENIISDDGAAVIAQALPSMKALTILFLDSNHIGDDGAAALAHVLLSTNKLTVLGLSYNQICDEGAIAFARVLPSVTRLTFLNLEFNQIGDEALKALSKSKSKLKFKFKLELENQIDILDDGN